VSRNNGKPPIVIQTADLRIAAVVVSVRFREAGMEQARQELADEFLRAEANLGRALCEHARSGGPALHEGLGSWNVPIDPDEVRSALLAYESIVRRLAETYGPLVASLTAPRPASYTDS
jgi:hypothetical protein